MSKIITKIDWIMSVIKLEKGQMWTQEVIDCY